MITLDGQTVARTIYEDIRARVRPFLARGCRKPCLAIVLVKGDPASEVYVRAKLRMAKSIDFDTRLLTFDSRVAPEVVEKAICDLAVDDTVDGIILQLPLPEGWSKSRLMRSIPVEKDVDGFHFENIGQVFSDESDFIAAATPFGICLLLRAYNVPIVGRHVVIVGRSHIVGKPLALLMGTKSMWGNATVTLCHSQTPNIDCFTRQADIVVLAVGEPDFLRADMVREGAVVVDVGINRVEDKRDPRGYVLRGDACYEELSHKVSFMTPVPGGVGPMTIAALMKNTCTVYERAQRCPVCKS